ncbi:hypothetical protein DS745_11165 [Anaerobacillus alkaliphilus]|uniref:Uncharacterized protein n=1 Tax=Anaerobacillus alkaliphilus TaxID=1548597 RepID=A0A4Q0VT75_9BACI|nr:hypothetical protein [Anaerobacillus alkaliphilus]RXJ00618.1 hypothetical protein DS745_11165 [Anaerobacillus alkaliphilus]
MNLDWECPKCSEKHISKINDIEVGDTLTLRCCDCNSYVKFEVIQKKLILVNRENERLKNAVAW